MKKTLVILYPYMRNVGGIEKYVYYLAQHHINRKNRVIWLCGDENAVADSFKDVMLDDRVERVQYRSKGFVWFRCDPILFSDELVSVIAFSPDEYAQAVHFANQYKGIDISCYYYVPNTTGHRYFPERYFVGRLKSYIQGRYYKLLQRVDEAKALKCFSYTQLEAIEKNYGISIADIKSKVISPAKAVPPLNMEELIARSKRVSFTIITVGRFDFPHKGYMLGLIRAYSQLKDKYPFVKLWIIGFGPDEDQVHKTIGELPAEHRKDVKLFGEVSPENVPDIIKNAHVNISVAGGIWSGAECGVLSIPARNYCPSDMCEVYGYLPNNMSTSTEPGESVLPYLEEIVNMSEEEYIEKSLASYQKCAANRARVNLDECFSFERNNSSLLTEPDISFFRFVEICSRIIIKIELLKSK